MQVKLEIIQRAEQFAKQVLGKDATGHDWWHIHRVRKMAVQLAAAEQADVFICELAALLHDIADEKLNESKEAGLQRVHTWLAAQRLDDMQVQEVMTIIATMSYNGGKNPPMTTLEGQIVQDADRLDAIGAIGIARTFTYGGNKNRIMHDPEQSYDHLEYRSSEKSTVYHFYEKLLLLKDRMNTNKAKEMAAERHQFMVEFLEQFYGEWDAKR